MLQCLVSFFIGGSLLSLVAFLAQKGNATLTILVANIPVMFLFNILMMYRAGGVVGSMNYAKGALMYLPLYILFIVITMWLIPRLGMPSALFPGVVVFSIPVLVRRLRTHINVRQNAERCARTLAVVSCTADNIENQQGASA